MKIIFSLLLFLFTLNTVAQVPVSDPEEVARKKEINSIKKQGEAVYADVYQEAATEEAALTEAEQKSKEMLKTHVYEIFSKRMGMSKEDVRAIWKVLESKCRHIVVKRGDLFRVFTYVMKNAVGSNDPSDMLADNGVAAVGTDVVPTPEPVPATTQEPKPVVPTPVPAPEPKPEPKPVVPTPVPTTPEPKPVVSAPVPTPEPKPEPKPVAPTPVPTPEPKPVVPTPVPAPEVKSETTQTPEPQSENAIPVLCKTIIEKGNFDSIYKYLKREKAYQRLMYGTARNMQYPEKCYIVLTNKGTGEIVAVLDKGQSERMNFITMKMDRYSNYRGGNYSAIFIQEY